MERTHAKKSDFSLLLIIGGVAVSVLLLSGCNPNSGGGATGAQTPETTPEESSSGLIPEAKADYKEGEFQPFSEAAYRKAMADNRKVFLDFHADWCPVCVGNHPVISDAFAEDYTDNVVGFQVDYDKEVALKEELEISSQSTLVLFEGPEELNRVMGPQSADSLEAFILNEADEITLEESMEPQVAASSDSYQLGSLQAFSKEKFDDAVADGKDILLDFHADWCHVCRSNEPVVKSAIESGNVVGLRIDYDTSKDLVAKYGVVSQSTYIVIKDGKEVARTLGPQSASTMNQLLSS